jgi:hypothetical protein
MPQEHYDTVWQTMRVKLLPSAATRSTAATAQARKSATPYVVYAAWGFLKKFWSIPCCTGCASPQGHHTPGSGHL